jgi:hypothetical protein
MGNEKLQTLILFHMNVIKRKKDVDNRIQSLTYFSYSLKCLYLIIISADCDDLVIHLTAEPCLHSEQTATSPEWLSRKLT